MGVRATALVKRVERVRMKPYNTTETKLICTKEWLWIEHGTVYDEN
jgi:hypothetical protein